MPETAPTVEMAGSALAAQQPSPTPKAPSFLTQKIAWGLNGYSQNIMNNGIAQVAVVIYCVGMGVDPKLIGWGLAIPRVWEALLGPFMGSLSDNFRSPWGRRRPFTIIGAILSAIFFSSVWLAPASLSHNALFCYFLITSMLFYLGTSIYSIPTGSLAFELSSDYNERTRIMGWVNFFGSLANLTILPWMWWLAIHLGKMASRGASGVKPEVIGMRYVGILSGLIILAFAIMPGIFCREGAEVMRQPKFNMWRAMGDALCNRAFLILSGIVLMLLVGLFAVGNLGVYVGIYYVCRSSTDLSSKLGAIAGMAYGAIGILSIPLSTWLGVRLGKRRALIGAQILIMVGSLATWFMNNPAHPYLSLYPPLIMCPGLTCLWLMTGSMMMEVCDLDELKSGLRREGMFGAVFGLVFKTGLAVTTVLAGYLVTWAGYQDGKPIADLALFRMRFWLAAIPAACLVITIVLSWLFPITEQSARKVRAVLDERKKELAEAGQAAS